MKRKIAIKINRSQEEYKLLPKNFKLQFEKKIVQKILDDLSSLTTKAQLTVSIFELDTNVETGNIVGANYVKIVDNSLTPIALISSLKIHWTGKTPGNDVFQDNSYLGEIFFELENYPKEVEIQEMIDSHNDFLMEVNKKANTKALRKSYKFKISHPIFFMDKEIKMKIKTLESEEVLDALLLKLNSEFNLRFPEAINYLSLKRGKKGWFEAAIDLGYGLGDAVDFILDGFNSSTLDIEKIILS